MIKTKMLVTVAALALPGAAIAQNIDTTGGAPVSDYWFPFGSGDTATYGQTFTAGAGQTSLQNFSLFLGNRYDGSGSLDLRGYFGTWNGSNVGSILYSSATQTTNGNQQFTFNTGGLGLTAGNQYVAFLSISGLPSQDQSRFYMPGANVGLADGNFVFINNGTDFSQITGGSWAVANPDVAFIANFGAGAVPEPTTWALMVLGFGAIGSGIRAAKRRQRAALRFA